MHQTTASGCFFVLPTPRGACGCPAHELPSPALEFGHLAAVNGPVFPRSLPPGRIRHPSLLIGEALVILALPFYAWQL
ncbi:MAG: hypothetical protein ABSB41_03990 [Anaerolineales bacterium]